MEGQVTTFATSKFPAVDPRVEFWSDPDRWPRETYRHSFLANVVHDLGKLLFREAWTGDEPATVIVYPIRPVLDTATSPADVEMAVHILRDYHAGFRVRADAVQAVGQPAPMPTADEWPIAHALSRQIADATWGAFKRYWGVVTTLVTVFELGIVTAARRHHVVGHPEPIPTSDWINEIYPSWFATCQIDPERPYCGVPVRDGGDWIYVELASYFAWRNASFGVLSSGSQPHVETTTAAEEKSAAQSQPNEAPANQSTDPVHSRPRNRGGAKPRYDWPVFDAEVMRRASSEDRPRSIRAFAEKMLQWCSETWGKEPGETTVRTRISEVLAKNGLKLE